MKPPRVPLKRNYIVSKSNALITSRSDLNLQEQRIVLSLISLIDSKNDNQFFEYEMRINEFAKMLEVEVNTTYLKKLTMNLTGKTLKIEDGETTIQTQWLSSAVYDEEKGTVVLELHRKLYPYLLQLKKRFTTYYLMNVLRFKSKYSIRLFELFKANQFKKELTITVDELRTMLCCENYDRYSNFNQRVLTPALAEINEHSDIWVNMTPVREGRNIAYLRFEIASRREVLKQVYGVE